MTTRIVRVGNTLTVEIPAELVVQAAMPVGEPVEWIPNLSGSIALVKQSDAAGQSLESVSRLMSFWREFPEGSTSNS